MEIVIPQPCDLDYEFEDFSSSDLANKLIKYFGLFLEKVFDPESKRDDYREWSLALNLNSKEFLLKVIFFDIEHEASKNFIFQMFNIKKYILLTTVDVTLKISTMNFFLSAFICACNEFYMNNQEYVELENKYLISNIAIEDMNNSNLSQTFSNENSKKKNSSTCSFNIDVFLNGGYKAEMTIFGFNFNDGYVKKYYKYSSSYIMKFKKQFKSKYNNISAYLSAHYSMKKNLTKFSTFQTVKTFFFYGFSIVKINEVEFNISFWNFYDYIINENNDQTDDNISRYMSIFYLPYVDYKIMETKNNLSGTNNHKNISQNSFNMYKMVKTLIMMSCRLGYVSNLSNFSLKFILSNKLYYYDDISLMTFFCKEDSVDLLIYILFEPLILIHLSDLTLDSLSLQEIYQSKCPSIFDMNIADKNSKLAVCLVGICPVEVLEMTIDNLSSFCIKNPKIGYLFYQKFETHVKSFINSENLIKNFYDYYAQNNNNKTIHEQILSYQNFVNSNLLNESDNVEKICRFEDLIKIQTQITTDYYFGNDMKYSVDDKEIRFAQLI